MKSTLTKKSKCALQVNLSIVFIFLAVFCFGLNTVHKKTAIPDITKEEMSPPAVINCSTVDCIVNAMRNASPGDEIVIASGTYTALSKTDLPDNDGKASRFYSNSNGTALQPITIRGPVVLTGLFLRARMGSMTDTL